MLTLKIGNEQITLPPREAARLSEGLLLAVLDPQYDDGEFFQFGALTLTKEPVTTPMNTKLIFNTDAP
ncbi:hypothetical protein [Serratia sp. NA_13]|uniref:hypothetical protein n=1 Tax=Serratia sp. NA_13 TaxID=3415658 RepID=UPI004046FD00